jgi:pimeloyl-ACP methyl ester carboxylesterase
MSPEPFEIAPDQAVVSDLRRRIEAARWPDQPAEAGWALGTDLAVARRVCRHWAEDYDFARLERLNALGSYVWDGIHFLRAGAGSGRVPVVLLHGWPSGPIEYEPAARLLLEAGREVIVPSLPGFAWSEPPHGPLNVAGMSAGLRELLDTGLQLDRYVLAGSDWGGIIAGRMAYDAPERVAGLYVSTPGVLPTPRNLEDPPMSEDEVAYAQRAQRWLRREGHHILIQSVAPDAISPGLVDSPAGLTAYLIEKYRRWSDSGGELERRFSLNQVCDFLTMFWDNGAIAPSMRFYWAERRDRWRLQPGETIDVPAAISVFPGRSKGELSEGGSEANTLATLNPPREWSERVLSDLRRWNRMPSGGHFGAFEEPELYARDLLAFMSELRP